jgi:hypothetical protein
MAGESLAQDLEDSLPVCRGYGVPRLRDGGVQLPVWGGTGYGFSGIDPLRERRPGVGRSYRPDSGERLLAV